MVYRVVCGRCGYVFCEASDLIRGVGIPEPNYFVSKYVYCPRCGKKLEPVTLGNYYTKVVIKPNLNARIARRNHEEKISD